ncbi:MAG: hypothetical protein WBE72_14120 [Terracidiphilus sp.]
MIQTAQIKHDADVIEHLAAIQEWAAELRKMARRAGFALLCLLICIGANVPFAAGFPLHDLTWKLPFFGFFDYAITMGSFLFAVIRYAFVWSAWSVGNRARKDTVELLEIRFEMNRQEARFFA